MLLLHILIALSSLIYTAYLSFFPSYSKLKKSYFLIALTLATGTYLLISTPSHMLQTCITGIIYLGVVTGGVVVARHRLAEKKELE